MRLATLQFETRLYKGIRMGITIFKILIWGGISSDIRSKNTFYRSLPPTSPLRLNRPYIPPYTSQNENFEYSYPLNSDRCKFRWHLTVCFYPVRYNEPGMHGSLPISRCITCENLQIKIYFQSLKNVFILAISADLDA